MSILKLLSWNMQHQENNWDTVLASGADAALLQEAMPPPPALLEKIKMDVSETGLKTKPSWRAVVAGLSNRIEFTPIETQPLGGFNREALMVSRPGTLAPAVIHNLETDMEIIIVSLYATWANPIAYVNSDLLYADASVHRLISDLSALIGRKSNHKIIVAGDLNILHGYGDYGSAYWKRRYDTAFDRMSALGFRFIGPQYPGGQKASPWPDELPPDSLNIPTFRTRKTKPETATRQLDYVFASESLADKVRVRAMNGPEEWGPSDHCRIFIDVDL